MSGLMDFKSVKKTFHENERATALLDGAVKIEQHVRFVEADRKAVFGLCLANCATRVGHKFATFVVNWNDHPSTKKTAPVVVANANVAARMLTQSTRCNIGMMVNDVAQAEG